MQLYQLTARAQRLRKRDAFGAARALWCATTLLFSGCFSPSDKSSDSALTDTSVIAPLPAPISNNQPAEVGVTEYGYGLLRAGMTYDEANAALHGALKAEGGANIAECSYVTWEGGPQGLRVMVDDGKIGRMDVIDSTVMTAAGARVGDTEEIIQRLYAGRVTVSPHKYTDGHYLTVRASNASDTMNFLIFETDNGKVTRFRGGIMPSVKYVEGCS